MNGSVAMLRVPIVRCGEVLGVWDSQKSRFRFRRFLLMTAASGPYTATRVYQTRLNRPRVFTGCFLVFSLVPLLAWAGAILAAIQDSLRMGFVMWGLGLASALIVWACVYFTDSAVAKVAKVKSSVEELMDSFPGNKS